MKQPSNYQQFVTGYLKAATLKAIDYTTDGTEISVKQVWDTLSKEDKERVHLYMRKVIRKYEDTIKATIVSETWRIKTREDFPFNCRREEVISHLNFKTFGVLTYESTSDGLGLRVFSDFEPILNLYTYVRDGKNIHLELHATQNIFENAQRFLVRYR